MRTFLGALVFAVTAAVMTPAQSQPVGIGTSPQGTFVYQLGATLAKAMTDNLGMQARVQPNSGTGVMIPLVNSGEIDIGFCNSLELLESYNGTGTFAGRANPNIRTAAVLFPLVTGLFVRADSPIKSIKDIKGKSIAYGFASQEIIRISVDAMLAGGGLTVADVKPVLVPNLIRGVDEFIAGRVDVATFAIGSAKVAEADAAVGGIRWIDLGNDPATEAAMKKIFRTAYIEKIEPANGLSGLKAPIYTMYYDYAMFANASMPADKIKAIVKILAEKRDDLARTSPGFAIMKTQRMYTDYQVPFHEGAKAYYTEAGIKPNP